MTKTTMTKTTATEITKTKRRRKRERMVYYCEEGITIHTLQEVEWFPLCESFVSQQLQKKSVSV